MFPKLILTNMYAVMDDLYYGVYLDAKKAAISDEGDIPTLLSLHNELDAVVAKAYGWPKDLSAEELLERLLKLNGIRAAEEKSGKILWFRPEFQGTAMKRLYSQNFTHRIFSYSA